MARKLPLVADLAVARATVSGVPDVKVAVPCLIYVGGEYPRLVWQSDNAYPVDMEHAPEAWDELERLRRLMVLEWPMVAGEVDWWTGVDSLV